MICLQFQLPSGAGGIAPGMASGVIRTELDKLVKSGKISQYKTTHTRNLQLNIWFKNQEECLLVFLMLKGNFFRSPVLVEYPDKESPFYEQ